MMVLPDTNVLIYALSGQKPFSEKLKQLTKQKQILLSVIAVAEFLIGATPENARRLNALIENSTIVSVDIATAKLAAQIRRKTLVNKTKTHLADCLIAAQCQLLHATLATNNPADYPKHLQKLVFGM